MMSWTKTQANGYDIYTTSALTLADNAGTNAEVVAVTAAIPDGVNWENVKFPVNADMTVAAGAAVTCDMILQTSSTGTTSDDVIGTGSAVTPSWVDSVAIDIDILAGGTANHSKECDASSVYAPYARFAIKTAATDLTDAAGRCVVSFAHKPSKPNNEGLASGDFSGVGKDPS
jgi:hypothetical protein